MNDQASDVLPALCRFQPAEHHDAEDQDRADQLVGFDESPDDDLVPPHGFKEHLAACVHQDQQRRGPAAPAPGQAEQHDEENDRGEAFPQVDGEAPGAVIVFHRERKAADRLRVFPGDHAPFLKRVEPFHDVRSETGSDQVFREAPRGDQERGRRGRGVGDLPEGLPCNQPGEQRGGEPAGKRPVKHIVVVLSQEIPEGEPAVRDPVQRAEPESGPAGQHAEHRRERAENEYRRRFQAVFFPGQEHQQQRGRRGSQDHQRERYHAVFHAFIPPKPRKRNRSCRRFRGAPWRC